MAGVDAVRTTLTHPALTVKRRLGISSHVRKFYQVVGFSLPNNYLVHNSSLDNLVRGVLTRVLLVKGKPAPQPPEGIYRERLGYFSESIMKRFPPTTPIDRDRFPEYYTGRKKSIYEDAVRSLSGRSISYRDATIKAFVKAEFINSDDKPDPDPRVISPRDPRYNVEVGRYLRPIEHRIYQAIDRMFGDKTVLKGYNAQEIGSIFAAKWKRYRKPVAIGLDASRFDQHVSVEALRWEHSVYNGIYHSKELRKLLRWQLHNNVVGYCRDGKLKYKTNGCRMSGDMNTAMGNCLIMCALVHSYLKSRGIPASLANNGDDCTVIMEQKFLDRFRTGLTEWFLEMGFNMKVENPVYNIEGIEFCQTHPVFVAGSYLMVRNFQKSLSKDCLSLKNLSSPRVCKAWIDAVGQGGLSLTGGVPVFQNFYRSFIRIASTIDVPKTRQGSKRRHRVPDAEVTGGLSWLSKNMERKFSPVEPLTRHSFYLAFGVTPCQQMALEAYFDVADFTFRVGELEKQVHLPRWA